MKGYDFKMAPGSGRVRVFLADWSILKRWHDERVQRPGASA